jgi:hypothetical protein
MAVAVFGVDVGKTIAVAPVMSNSSISNVKCKEDTSPEYIRYFKRFKSVAGCFSLGGQP